MSLRPRYINFNEKWNLLQETVQDVMTVGNVSRSIWYDRFTDVYLLCVAHPEPLADQLYLETKKFLIKHVENLLDNVRAQGDNNLLKSYYVCWTEYLNGVECLNKLYQYLNQQHIRKQKLSEPELIYSTGGNGGGDNTQEKLEIGELGLDIWRSSMIMPLREQLIQQLLDGIQADRQGQCLQTSTSYEIIHGVIASFVQVHQYRTKEPLVLYEEIFEGPFLSASGEYFKSVASQMLAEYTVSAYIERVMQKLREEVLRAHRFLHCTTVRKVQQKCEQHMVADHLSFLYSECREMVREERRKDLANLYPLLKSVPDGLSRLITEFLEHVKTQGLEAAGCLRGDVAPAHFVENVLAVHSKYRRLIDEVFGADQSFINSLDRGCAHVINHRTGPKQACRSPELLAKYCDALLKRSARAGLSEQEADERLAQSITVFKYLDDKDIFQKFYSRMLAKRLIHQQSTSMDAEEAMINRFKQACGYEFTNKLHRMFTDVSLSSDLNNKFNGYLRENGTDLGIGFQIYVLQAGAWPLGGQVGGTTPGLPSELERAMQHFESFYHLHYSGRKLTWLHHLCQGELRLGYLRRPYVATLQTFQMAALLLFEQTDSLTLRDIRTGLGLSVEQASRHISGLLDCKLLLSEGAEEMDDATTLRLNFEYSNKRTKFRVPAGAQKEAPQEAENTVVAVEEDRKLYLQAAVVRIMKARKVLRHNDLIQEVLAQTKVTFAPSVQMIKKCIEALIDKQYIERTPNAPDSYSYVA